MKKIYSLLLLSGLLLLGAQSMRADNFLAGDWETSNTWIWGVDLTRFTNISGTEYLTLYLTSGRDYYFKVLGGGTTHYGVSGTIEATTPSAWTLYHYDQGETPAVKLTPTVTGPYRFQLTWSGNPQLKVIYPTDPVDYTIKFYNPTGAPGWSNIYAYAYSDGGKVEQINNYPGKQVTSPVSDLYTCTFKSDVAPSNVIWSDGSTSNKHEYEFHNGATYCKESEEWKYYYQLTVGEQGWASMYLDFAATVPANTTAYYASSVSNTSVTLTPIAAGSVIPKNTGVVVKAAAGTYKFYAADDVSAVSNNFDGKITAESVEANTVYVLSPASTTSSCVFGLYTGTTLGANKAYMLSSKRPAAAPAIDRIEFIIENATNIDNIEASEEAVKFFQDGKLYIKKNGVVYDMVGAIVK